MRTLGPPKDGVGFEIASVAIVAAPIPLTRPTFRNRGTESSWGEPAVRTRFPPPVRQLGNGLPPL
jgi:hypothetical protein